ncbi:MAG: phosphate ABC transporter substrate-binding protein [Cyanobacteriota bacterium]|nr:phosphate ABC transporter substrate-binding protein [Cyanobacteriota bacterium]
MARRSGPPPIVFILAFLLLAGAAYWFFVLRDKQPAPTVTNIESNGTPAPSPPPVPVTSAFPAPTNVAGGTIIRIDGSTSMVAINQSLKNSFETQFPNTSVATSARGSSQGIQGLLAGNVDVAASSRPLTNQEQAQGLEAIPVALDKIAIVVGVNNPFNQGLTSDQVKAIFQGQITNWSEVGGSNSLIRVINRPPVSGTHQMFKKMILDGEDFGSSFNISTMERDATTPMLRALGNDGIGYATYAQVEKQQTVRSLPIDGLMPNSATYPFSRQLFYVYKNPPSQAVKDFLGYATSPQGQQVIFAE